ncbi:MAG: hypothetical protein J6K88_02790 [Oscillospiraceae bacterium]|nr:hypothetical protein [Oscillospiraceae bacterium]
MKKRYIVSIFIMILVLLSACHPTDKITDTASQTQENEFDSVDFISETIGVSVYSSDRSFDFLRLSNKYRNQAQQIAESLSVDGFKAINSESPKDKGYISLRFNDLITVNYDTEFTVYENDIVGVKIARQTKNYKAKDGTYERLKSLLIEISQEHSKYYKINCENFSHTYYLYDKAGNVVVSKTTGGREPHIQIVGEGLLSVMVSGGTGTLTRNTFFYNYETGETSPNYSGIVDICGEYICRTGQGVYIYKLFEEEPIAHIRFFEKQLYYYTIEPIGAAAFINGGKELSVSYMQAENAEYATQTFSMESILRKEYSEIVCGWEDEIALATKEEDKEMQAFLREIYGEVSPETSLEHVFIINGKLTLDDKTYYLCTWNWLVEADGVSNHISKISDILVAEDRTASYECWFPEENVLEWYPAYNRI